MAARLAAPRHDSARQRRSGISCPPQGVKRSVEWMLPVALEVQGNLAGLDEVVFQRAAVLKFVHRYPADRRVARDPIAKGFLGFAFKVPVLRRYTCWPRSELILE